jgi:formylglycine-generating enzyme required for sulfatase activity
MSSRLLAWIIFIAFFAGQPVAAAPLAQKSDDPLRHGHALLIGNSIYKDRNWPQLDDIPLQLKALYDGLKDHFDSVEVSQNLETEKLWQTIDNFVRVYGNETGARLFVYYAGHGYTEIISQFDENRGYITGTDTPAVSMGTTEAYDAARLRSISMLRIRSLLQDSVARHVLFVFDSCFAGTIFTTRSGDDPPRPLSPAIVARLLEKPSRDFITAGSARERVPARSPLPALFLEAIGGAADKYQQGVVSASEIGRHLRYRMSSLADGKLNPQQGKLPDTVFAEGEFLFRVNTGPDARMRDPALAVAPGSGKSFRENLVSGQPCLVCPEMVVVPGGVFAMGPGSNASDQAVQHPVGIPRAFAIGKFAVTVGEFKSFVAETDYVTANGCTVIVEKTKANGFNWSFREDRSWRLPGFPQDDRHPVVCINWNDALAYVTWLSRKTGKFYRLITEAEWEFAARAGTTTKYYFGDDIKDYCRYGNGPDKSFDKRYFAYFPAIPCDDGFMYTSPVGSFPPNPFGLFDMHGNAWTWLEDCGHKDYEGAPRDGSAWLSGDCSTRMIRGGSWAFIPVYLDIDSRVPDPVESRFDNLGLRVARTLNP